MFLAKFKIAAAVLLAVSFIGSTAGLVSHGGFHSEKPAVDNKSKPESKVDSKEIKPQANEQLKLKTELLQTANAEWNGRMKEFETGRGRPEALDACAHRLLQAELENAKNYEGRVAAWKTHFARMSNIENMMKAWFEAGKIQAPDFLASKFRRIEAQLGLERAKQQ